MTHGSDEGRAHLCGNDDVNNSSWEEKIPHRELKLKGKIQESFEGLMAEGGSLRVIPGQVSTEGRDGAMNDLLIHDKLSVLVHHVDVDDGVVP